MTLHQKYATGKRTAKTALTTVAAALSLTLISATAWANAPLVVGAAVAAKAGKKVIGKVAAKAANSLRESRVVLPQAADKAVLHTMSSGKSQQAFLNGKAVAGRPAGSTVPDVIGITKGTAQSIAVENKVVNRMSTLNGLAGNVGRQTSHRAQHLPPQIPQRVNVFPHGTLPVGKIDAVIKATQGTVPRGTDVGAIYKPSPGGANAALTPFLRRYGK